MDEHDWVNIIPVLVRGCLSVRQQHMSNIFTAISDLPPEQRAIQDKCFHPTGRFVEFKREEIEQSIPDRFEQQVAKHPDRLAVKTKSHQFTYDELNKAANRVARAILAQRGEGNEPVALLLEQGAALIAALFAVLKAGKICVPLDPSLGRARITSILEDSQAGLIVTNSMNFHLAIKLARNALKLINLDDLGSRIADENPTLSISPDTLSWVLYTSGSTGKPKGVANNHRNLLHNALIRTNAFHICEHDRLTLLASGTGLATGNILSTLLNGAALYPLDIREEGVAPLADWLIQEEITIFYLGVNIFRHIASTLTEKEEFPKVRLIRLGTDQVTKNDVELYKKHFSRSCILVNLLSTSETGTFRYYFVDKETSISGNSVPVGYPFEDMKISLLDEGGKEIGVNGVGEIVVKSRYLSPGYWRRPELTRAAFLPDPKGGDERIYLTGDLGRMSEDGCLEHLGRRDFQVKVRGFRIETGEVEMRLSNHTAIKEVAVVAQRYQSGDKRLVAYFVPSSKPAPNTSELRRFLSEKLPDYMIPSAFVMLEAMPLTPNGKVDRKALPIPDSSRPELDTPYVAPRTPVEKEVAQMWAEVVGVDQVGIHDNFFDLGGHSLAATRVISRVINTFKVELHIKSLFESPTVADMAVVITENMAKKAGDEELAHMLTELESLSDEEAQRLLAEEGK